MGKRGQESIGLSFGMIFSIVIIIAVVGVAFYAISYFMKLNKCTQAGLFYDDLENEIKLAHRSGDYENYYEVNVPSSIEYACFGDLNYPNAPTADKRIQDKLKDVPNLRNGENNIYLYPPKEACDGDLGGYFIKEVDIDGFFCVPVIDGEVTVKLNMKNEFLKVKLES